MFGEALGNNNPAAALKSSKNPRFAVRILEQF